MSKKTMIALLLAAVCMLLCACGGKQADLEPEEELPDPDASEIALVLGSGEIGKLDGYTALRVADLSGSENFEEIYAWSQAHPSVVVYYDVKLPTGETVGNRVTELDLSKLTGAQTDEAIRCMSCLPKVARVELGSERSGFGFEDIRRLQEAFPQVRFSYAFTLYGHNFNITDTEIDLYHVPVDDNAEAVRQAMACMPKLTYVDLDSCGADYERLAEIRDEFPDVKVVWRVWFGDAYSVRTDVEKILASKPSVGGGLYIGNVEPLKYCTEVKYLDVGHNEDLATIDFVAYMPKLEVAILAMAKYTDLSPLANCKQLEYLEIQTTPVYDLSPLAGLTNLRHLNICNTCVQDISPCYSLTKLERFWIGGWVAVPREQVELMQQAAPDCMINTGAGDPTEGQWRYIDMNLDTYVMIMHPRYALLQEQFGYTDKDFSFWWNDPLY